MNIKIDKRSQRTREALKKTLAQMMIKQNINDITIKNLVVLANINRSTLICSLSSRQMKYLKISTDYTYISIEV